jgi:3-hydroxyisobutyrate dehydrogenase-like beta-hydroxyacid dehydrogenase
MSAAGAAGIRVGLAGLGRMGTPMARNLAAADLLVGVHSRTEATRTQIARELGVECFATPRALAEACDVIVTSVTDGDAVRLLYEGPAGFLEGIRPGSLGVEMSTIGPHSVEWLAGRLAACDCGLVDAPVSGSVALAASRTLTIMAGGSAEDFARALPALEAVGSTVFHLGPVGSGATMKLAVNNVVYGLNQSLAESLVLAERAGVDRLRAYEVFAASAVAAPFVLYRRDAFERPGDGQPAMPLVLAQKDLDLILDLATRLGARLPQAEVNARVTREAEAAGYAAADISAIAVYLRESC